MLEDREKRACLLNEEWMGNSLARRKIKKLKERKTDLKKNGNGIHVQPAGIMQMLLLRSERERRIDNG